MVLQFLLSDGGYLAVKKSLDSGEHGRVLLAAEEDTDEQLWRASSLQQLLLIRTSLKGLVFKTFGICVPISDLGLYHFFKSNNVQYYINGFSNSNYTYI